MPRILEIPGTRGIPTAEEEALQKPDIDPVTLLALASVWPEDFVGNTVTEILSGILGDKSTAKLSKSPPTREIPQDPDTLSFLNQPGGYDSPMPTAKLDYYPPSAGAGEDLRAILHESSPEYQQRLLARSLKTGPEMTAGWSDRLSKSGGEFLPGTTVESIPYGGGKRIFYRNSAGRPVGVLDMDTEAWAQSGKGKMTRLEPTVRNFGISSEAKGLDRAKALTALARAGAKEGAEFPPELSPEAHESINKLISLLTRMAKAAK